MKNQTNNSTNFLARQCKECQNKMYFKSMKTQSNTKTPWNDKEFLYLCDTCNYEAVITHSTSILNNIVSGFFILIALCYFLLTGLFEFILYSFTQSFFSIIAGIILTLLVILFFIGSLLNIKSGFQQIQTNMNYPLIKNKSDNIQNSNQIRTALFLGALPIVFALLFGMIDFYWYEINETWVMLLLPIIFSPIIFAHKLKSSVIEVFYGTLFWFILGLSTFYLFK